MTKPSNDLIEKYPADTYMHHRPEDDRALNSIVRDYHYRKPCPILDKIEAKIQQLLCWKFIAYPAEAEFIEALVRLTESKNVLEIGMYQGFSTLHLIRGVWPDGKVTTIECNPAHDTAFFEQDDIGKCFRFIKGKTPEAIQDVAGQIFDLVFVDSDHSPEHTERERIALWSVTQPGSIFVFHDLPIIQSVGATELCPIRQYIQSCIARGLFGGCIVPSGFRVDNAIGFRSVNYDRRLNPNIGVFIRA